MMRFRGQRTSLLECPPRFTPKSSSALLGKRTRSALILVVVACMLLTLTGKGWLEHLQDLPVSRVPRALASANHAKEESALSTKQAMESIESRSSQADSPPRNDAVVEDSTEPKPTESDSKASEPPAQRSGQIITWNGFQAMEDFAQPYFNDHNLFCETVDEARRNASDPALPVTFEITFGCKELFRQGGFGTGNYISTFYGIRLATQMYENVNVHLTCNDAQEAKRDLILPWFTGNFEGRAPGSEIPFPTVTMEQACSTYQTVPIGQLHREMQYDLRRMAIALVGIPGPDHPSAQFAEQYLWSDQAASRLQLSIPRRDEEPIYPRVELDDAVIHFRCGDLMDSDHPNFAFLRFNGYTKHISSEAKTIGIITQPFESGGQARGADASSDVRDRCRIVVTALVDYIQERHPTSRIRIHNGPEETISLAYARMIMANETIAGISTFGVFPVMATFGKGYLRSPEYPTGRGPNMWTLKPRLDSLVDNLSLVEDKERIMVAEIKQLWETEGERGVVAWFKGETFVEKQ